MLGSICRGRLFLWADKFLESYHPDYPASVLLPLRLRFSIKWYTNPLEVYKGSR